ncbi:MAG TPA: M13 family metallopeptidase N-terminal domain-containing protein, partial [Longimicrobium sp.]|nr:M13 family metallopeptidase N-terminal domain-containing protein [Longimicrobium sp.]
MRKLFLPLALFLAACATTPRKAPVVDMPRPKPLLGQNGFDLAQVDRSVAPCDDFYEYAVGGWRKANPLPAIYSRYGRFEEVADRNRETLKKILESSSSATNEPGSSGQKV